MAAADHHRVTLMGFGAVLVAVETAVLGADLGGIAQQTSAIWPVTIILVLNAAAVVAALRAPTWGVARSGQSRVLRRRGLSGQVGATELLLRRVG